MKSVLRPGLIAIPAVMTYRTWWFPQNGTAHAWISLMTAATTLFLAWLVGLRFQERQQLAQAFGKRFGF